MNINRFANEAKCVIVYIKEAGQQFSVPQRVPSLDLEIPGWTVRLDVDGFQRKLVIVEFQHSENVIFNVVHAQARNRTDF